MLRFVKVVGNSLEPHCSDGDFVIVSQIPICFRALKPGDWVVFHHPVYRKLIKQIQWLDWQKDQFFVVGTNEESVDSREFGPVPRQFLKGKVIAHIRKQRSR